jgi:hypothetical protein
MPRESQLEMAGGYMEYKYGYVFFQRGYIKRDLMVPKVVSLQSRASEFWVSFALSLLRTRESGRKVVNPEHSLEITFHVTPWW